MSISSLSYPRDFSPPEPSISEMDFSSSSPTAILIPTLPLGAAISFTPTDSQIIKFLLHDSAPSFIITDCDLFGHEEPWQIWDRYLGFRTEFNPDELYFFTPALKKLSPNGGSRIQRTIGGGNWTQKEPVKLVYDDEDQGMSIGVKRKLKYQNQKSDQNSQWCLDEYTGVEVSTSCAIFRLRRNERQHKSLSGICVEDVSGTLPIEPWEIWERYSVAFNNPDLLYFFASCMKRMSSKGKGCNLGRRVGSGTWNQKEAAKLVYEDEGGTDQDRKPIGRKRKLRYVNQGSEHHGEWYLEEYTSLVDEGAVLLLRRNERYKAPSDIPKEKKRKRKQIDQLEDKKPRKKKVCRQLVLEDLDHSATRPTVPIQQPKLNVDDHFEFFRGVDIGSWEFPSLDDFVMECPPPPEDCDLVALASLEFPFVDDFFKACPPPLTDCDQETTFEFPSPPELASYSPSAGGSSFCGL